MTELIILASISLFVLYLLFKLLSRRAFLYLILLAVSFSLAYTSNSPLFFLYAFLIIVLVVLFASELS